ncbi:unnamed protein product [Prorocentrum cordatum]|uniref:FAD/NAD(P)-binding domain-containing protein n=1 Tax=Prorocentrum cordatum TaxID=2364126 RepID=A0ABN9X125_9DINO|nr:unnamed protein product [Polarella glacialis]
MGCQHTRLGQRPGDARGVMSTGGAAPSDIATASRGAHEPRPLVVVGHGPTSHAFLKSLRLQSPVEYQVTVLCEEPRPAYDRVRLTEYLQDRDSDRRDRMRLSLVSEAEMLGRGVRLVYGRGTAIDRHAKLVTVVTVAGAEEQLPYEVLVLATGSSCFVPPVPGLSLPHKANPLWPDDPASRPPGVFVYRTIEDLDRLIAAVERGASKAAVIGGGLLGLEVAGALRDLGLDCCVLESAPHLLSSQLNRAAGEMLAQKVADLGLTVHTEAVLDEVMLQDGRASSVRFYAAGASEPSEVEVQIVVVAAGVVPRDGLARGCGLALGRRGGVKVDSGLRSSDPSIFAIGEVAAIGLCTCYGLWAPGVEQAGALARVLAEGPGAARYEGSDLSTDLKLAGVPVAAFGRDAAFWAERQFDDGAQGVRHEDLYGEEAGVYAALPFSRRQPPARRHPGGRHAAVRRAARDLQKRWQSRQLVARWR